ncbi:AraC family transcriptional regulator [Sphingomonas glacialis]|uniref:AraC family transcriptional regulator n=1 Tax=Sphingomonas glacialis TaxID=658225 RepID=A0A502G482_9SPHN|nr:helix-turn-helix domain-containing protein [Sphingomonas glacialis]TPG56381.1 AraC family transcriptional regulator [Sphingomonas glacialis]
MTSDALTFGWRTALLLVASAQMAILAGALWRPLANRAANRTLAWLLIVLIGTLTPYTIGFAGFYDRYPWLSFAPFAVPLAIGPLLYGYAHAIAFGARPARFRWHLAPAVAQFAYQAALFPLPLQLKNRWDTLASPILEPSLTLALIASLGGYGIASLGVLRRYGTALAQQRSDDDRLSARWLGRAVVALLLLLTVSMLYAGWSALIAPLDYFGDMGRYLVIAAIGCYLGVEGWRHADLHLARVPAPAAPDAPSAARDWRAQGEAWASRVREEQWHRDPELSLPTLARLLSTNTGHLSRALNEGLGVNFSTFIAGLRCEDVATALRAGSEADLLGLALDAGFGSKATFNRVFRARFGQSPSAYRRSNGSKPE